MEEERIVLKKKILIQLQQGQKVEEKETEQVEQK